MLPELKNKNATDGAALETFFLELDNAFNENIKIY